MRFWVVGVILAVIHLACGNNCSASESVDSSTLQKSIEKAYKDGLGKYTLPPGIYRLEGARPGRDCLNFTHVQDFDQVWPSPDRTHVPTDVLFYFTECKNIVLSGNSVLKPGPHLRQLVETNGAVEAKGLHDGISLP
jgi:hypothetical protein